MQETEAHLPKKSRLALGFIYIKFPPHSFHHIYIKRLYYVYLWSSSWSSFFFYIFSVLFSALFLLSAAPEVSAGIAPFSAYRDKSAKTLKVTLFITTKVAVLSRQKPENEEKKKKNEDQDKICRSWVCLGYNAALQPLTGICA